MNAEVLSACQLSRLEIGSEACRQSSFNLSVLGQGEKWFVLVLDDLA